MISDCKVTRDDEKIVIIIIIDINFVLDKWFLSFSVFFFLIEPLESTNCLHLFHIDEVSGFPNVFSVVFYK